MNSPQLPDPTGYDGWTNESLYCSSHDYFDDVIEGIERAVHSVDLATYIFRLDSVGQRLISVLLSKAQQGIKIRLTVDGVGSLEDAGKIAQRLASSGVQFRIFHPLPWQWSNFRWSLKPGSSFEKMLYFIFSVNRRDHRKFIIVDREIVWCGSQNICEDHINHSPSWRDYGVKLGGAPVAELSRNFDSVWHRYGERFFSPFSLRYFISNNSQLMRRKKNRLLVKWIDESKQRVWICNAYFAPARTVLNAIKRASARGVDVRIIATGKSDIEFFPTLSASYYSELLSVGVSVYSQQERVLHAKALLIDHRGLIGSSNLNYRSFYHDLELDIVLGKPETVARLEGFFKEDMAQSLAVSQANVALWKRSAFSGWFLRLLRYWM